VLQIEQPAWVIGPVVDDYATGRVGRDTARGTRQFTCCTDVLHPHVEAVVAPRREIGDAVPVRRHGGQEALWWAEEVLDRDEFGEGHGESFRWITQRRGRRGVRW